MERLFALFLFEIFAEFYVLLMQVWEFEQAASNRFNEKNFKFQRANSVPQLRSNNVNYWPRVKRYEDWNASLALLLYERFVWRKFTIFSVS